MGYRVNWGSKLESSRKSESAGGRFVLNWGDGITIQPTAAQSGTGKTLPPAKVIKPGSVSQSAQSAAPAASGSGFGSGYMPSLKPASSASGGYMGYGVAAKVPDTPQTREAAQNGWKGLGHYAGAAASKVIAPVANKLTEAGTMLDNAGTARQYNALLQAERGKPLVTAQYDATKVPDEIRQNYSYMTPHEKETALTKSGLEQGAYINSLDLTARRREAEAAARKQTAAQMEAAANVTKKAARGFSGLEGSFVKMTPTESPEGRIIAARATGKESYALGKVQGLTRRSLDTVTAGETASGRKAAHEYLSTTQRKTIEKYAQAGDFQSVADYYHAILPDLQSAAQGEAEKKNEKFSEQHPALSMPTQLALGMAGAIPSLAETVGGNIKNALTGEYHDIDPNSPAFAMTAASQAQARGAEERLEDHPVLSIMRGGTISAAQNLFLLYLGGGAAAGRAAMNTVLAGMGVSAAGTTAYEDLKEGKSAGRALLNALVDAGIETATEEIGMERWFKVLNQFDPKLVGNSLRQIARQLPAQMFVEGMEEVIGNELSQTWDMLSEGERSEYSSRIRFLMSEGGMSRREAEEQAALELHVLRDGKAFAEAAFSVLLMDGGPASISAVQQRQTFATIGRDIRQHEGSRAVNKEIEKGLLFPEDSTAHRAAEKISERWKDGKGKVSNHDIGRLSFLNGQALKDVSALIEQRGDAVAKAKLREVISGLNQDMYNRVSTENLRELVKFSQENAVPTFEEFLSRRKSETNPARIPGMAEIQERLSRMDLDAEGKPLISYRDALKEIRAALPAATQSEAQDIYRGYLRNRRTVLFGGHRLTLSEFTNLMRQSTDGDQLSVNEITGMFHQAILDTLDGTDAFDRYMEPARTQAEAPQNVTDTARMAAETADRAGQTAAETAEAVQREGSREGTQAPKETTAAGLDTLDPVTAEVVKGMNRKAASRIDDLGRLLGKRITFAYNVDEGRANGQISGNEIVLDRALVEQEHDGDRLFWKILGHELTHGIQESAREAYEKFREAVSKLASVQEQAKNIRELYRMQNRTITEEGALDEAVADYAGEIMRDTDTAQRFIDRNLRERTLLEKIRDAIVNLVKKLTGAEKRRAQSIQGLFDAALDSAAQNVREGRQFQQAEGQSAARYSIEEPETMEEWEKSLQEEEQKQKKNPALVTKQDEKFQKQKLKSAESVSEEDVRTLLEYSMYGGYTPGSYIPIRRNTPSILLQAVARHSGGEAGLEDLPIIANVGKLQRIADEDTGSKSVSRRGHGISVDGMIEIIKGMDDPAYIVYQKENGRYVEVVRYYDQGRKNAIAVLDFGELKYSRMLSGGYKGRTFNVLVTAFNPDSLDEYLNAKDENHEYRNIIIYKKTEGEPQIESGGITFPSSPSYLSGSPFADSIADSAAESKGESEENGKKLSLKGTEDAEKLAQLVRETQKENRQLKKDVEYWRAQTRLTDDYKKQTPVAFAAIQKASRNVLAHFDSTLKAGEILPAMRELVLHLNKGPEGEGAWTDAAPDHAAQSAAAAWITQADTMARSIASKVVTNAAVLMNDEEMERVRQIRAEMRTFPLAYDRDAIARETNFSVFWKRNQGRIRLQNKNGETLESHWKDWAERYGEEWFPSYLENETDRLFQIERVLDALDQIRPDYINPHSIDMIRAVEECKTAVLNAAMDAAPRAATFADRQKNARAAAYQKGLREGEARRKQILQNFRQSVEQERERSKQRLEAYKAKEAARREQRKAREEERKVHARVERIMKRLNNRRMLQRDRAMYNSILANIDAIAQETIGVNAETVHNHLLEYWKKLDENSDLYDEDFIRNPQYQTLNGNVTAAETMNETPKTPEEMEALKQQTRALTPEQLERVCEYLLAFDHAQRTIDEMIAARDKRNLDDQADVFIGNVQKSAPFKFQLPTPFKNEQGDPKTVTAADMLRAETFAKTITNFADNDSFQNAVQDLIKGETSVEDYKRRAAAFMWERFLRRSGLKQEEALDFLRTLSGQEAVDEEAVLFGEKKDGNGNTVLPKKLLKITGTDANAPPFSHRRLEGWITRGMLCSLYMDSKNEDNMRHVRQGGLKIPSLEGKVTVETDSKGKSRTIRQGGYAAYRRGDYAEAYAQGVLRIRLSNAEVQEIIENLTDTERAFCDAVADYYDSMSKQELTRVHELLKGWSPFHVVHYMPIETDSMFNKVDYEAMRPDGTMSTPGFSIQRVESGKPILLRDLNLVFTSSMNQHARFIGMSIPVRNINKLLNRNRFLQGAVEEAVRDVYGPDGLRAVEDKVGDIQRWAEEDVERARKAVERAEREAAKEFAPDAAQEAETAKKELTEAKEKLKAAEEVAARLEAPENKPVMQAVSILHKKEGVNKIREAMKENGSWSSVRAAVEDVYGTAGIDYIDKLMTDITKPQKEMDPLGRLLSNLTSNYASAVLTLSGSVAPVQTASFPTAAAEIGWKALGIGLRQSVQDYANKKPLDMETIKLYTPLLWSRSQGFTTHEMEDLRNDTSGMPPWMRTLSRQKWHKWIQGMDVLTTSALWRSCEAYVDMENEQRQKAGLDIYEKGTRQQIANGESAYYQEVAEVYNRVIRRTQPSYGVMERPQVLRSDNALIRLTNMFMTQMYQNFNILYEAANERGARARENNAVHTKESEAALKAADKKLLRAVVSQFAAALMAAAFKFAWALFIGKDDKYRDKEGDLTLLSAAKGVALGTVATFPGMVPYGSEIYAGMTNLVDGLLKGSGNDPFFNETMYGVNIGVFQSAQTTATRTVSAAEALIGAAGKVLAGYEDEENGKGVNWQETVQKTLAAATDLSQFFTGFPARNIERLAWGLMRLAVRPFLGNTMGEYALLHLTASPEEDKKAYYDLLFSTGGKSFIVNPEGKNVPEDYQTLYRQMVKDGFDAEEIQKNMKSRWMKSAAYSKRQGDAANALSAAIGMTPAYSRLTSDQRKKLSESVKSVSKYQTFCEYADGYQPEKSEQWIEKALDLNKTYRIALPALLILRAGKYGVTGIQKTEETADGTEKTSTISNSAGLRIMESAYRLFPEIDRWDEEKRKAVFEWLDVGKTISWYDSSMVSSELEQKRES